MHQAAQFALFLLQCKLPALAFERHLATAVNLSVDGVRFMLAFFAACACGAVLRSLRSFSARRGFATWAGFVLCTYVFGAGVLHGLVSLFINWAIVRLAPQRAGTLAWLFNFPHLALCHALSGDTWQRGDLDFTGAMMVLFLKAVSLGTNRAEGTISLDSSTASEYLRERRLESAPSLRDLAAFFFANGNLLGGPFFEFAEWNAFLQRRAPFHEVFESTNGHGPPSCIAPAARKMLIAFLYLAVYTALSAVFPKELVWSADFAAYPMYRKLACIWLVGLVFRMKFYFVWTLSDANFTLAGFGFNGWQNKAARVARWDRLTNGWPLQIEAASSTAKLMHVWNSRTGLFLRRYVYEKLTFGQKKPGLSALILTNFVSALWHGLEPTYGLLFLTGALLTEASRFLYEQEGRLPQRGPVAAVWTGAKIAWTVMSMNYAALSFYVYDIPLVLEAWGHFYYIFHLVSLAMVVARAILPRKRPPSLKAHKTINSKSDGTAADNGNKHDALNCESGDGNANSVVKQHEL